MKEQEIQRKYSCRSTPQQNGVTERKNSHIAEVARDMKNEKKMSDYFWAEAVATAVYIMNRTPTVVVHGMTLEEKYTCKKPNISHLKLFGCIAYSLQQKGYRCYKPSTHRMQVSRDVVFDEMSCWYGPTKVIEDADAGSGNVVL